MLHFTETSDQEVINKKSCMNTVPTDFFQESAFVSHQDPTHLVFFEDVSLSKKKNPVPEKLLETS